MSEIKIKVQLPNEELRRVTLDRSEVTIEALRSRVATMVSVPVDAVVLGFVDTENEVITISTTAELIEMIADSEKFSRIPRLVVTLAKSSSSSSTKKETTTTEEDSSNTKQEQQQRQQQQQQDEPQEEEQEHERAPVAPLELLAQLLVRPEVVAKLQRTIVSPVVWDALSAAASAYLEQGPVGGITTGMAQVPACRAVLQELFDEVPELQAIFARVVESHMGSFDPLAALFAATAAGAGGGGCHPAPHHHARHHHHQPRCGPPHPSHGQHPFAFGGGRGPFGPFGGRWGHCGQPQQPQPQPQQQTPEREIHLNVVCDGCSSSFRMKRLAFFASNVTRSGNIAGPRFKSTSLDDYDLCDTCHASGRFEEYGPFVRVPGQHQQPAPSAPAAPPPPNNQGNPWAGNNPCENRPRGCRGGGGAFGRCGGIRNVIHEVMSQEASNMAAAIAASLREANEEKKTTTTAGAVKVVEPDLRAPSVSSKEPPVVVVAPSPQVTPAPSSVAFSAASTASTARSHGHDDEEEEEEWEDAGQHQSTTTTAAQEDPVEKWRAQLSRLADLGFTDIAQYLPIIEEEQGDLERVVNRIIRRNA